MADIKTTDVVIRALEPDEFGALARLCNTASMHVLGVEETDEDELRHDLSALGFDLARDTRVMLTPEGEMLAEFEVWPTNAPYVRNLAWFVVHPDYEDDHELIRPLTDWMLARGRELVEMAPPGARVVLFTYAHSPDVAKQRLLKMLGFREVRRFYRMGIDMAEKPAAPQWPEGITVRAMRHNDADMRATFAAVDDAFRDHWGYVERPFEEAFARWKYYIDGAKDFDPDLFFLAMDGDQIAGMSLCWPHIAEDRGLGWVGTLGVRRPWRKRGLGHALLVHSFRELWDRGQRRVALGVDASSLTGATRLYEKAGMRVIRLHLNYELVLRDGEDISTQAVE